MTGQAHLTPRGESGRGAAAGPYLSIIQNSTFSIQHFLLSPAGIGFGGADSGSDCGGFVAVGAAEGVEEENGEGDAQAVTAEDLAGLPVIRATPVEEDGGHAEWTVDVGGGE